MGLINFLQGKKTYIGGIGALAVGFGTILDGWANGKPVDYNMVMAWIVGGWSAIGLKSACKKCEK